MPPREVDTAREQPRTEVTRGEDRIVGEHEEGATGRRECPDEVSRSGDGVLLVDEHPVHVGQPRLDPVRLSHSAIVVPQIFSSGAYRSKAASCRARPEVDVHLGLVTAALDPHHGAEPERVVRHAISVMQRQQRPVAR